MFNRRGFIAGVAAAPLVAWSLPSFAAEQSTDNLAEMLHRALAKRGVSILPIDETTIADGARIGAMPANGGYWIQRHVDYCGNVDEAKCMDALAKNLAQTSRQMRFGHLWIPSNQVSYARRDVYRDVTARKIVCNVLEMDVDGLLVERVTTRIDALFAIA
jgi:hypothetical protein